MDNPLFLKLFCSSLHDAGHTEVPKGLQGITSVFNFYVDTLNEKLSKDGEVYDPKAKIVQQAMLHLNLLAAIIIYWNTKHLGQIIHDRKQQGVPTPPDKLAHLSPLGWEHIILTGFYKW